MKIGKPPRAVQAGAQLNNSANHGYVSSNDSAFLPDIKRVTSKSSQRTNITQITQKSTATQRKASPEALALMMQNMKGNKQPKNWVPSGVQSKPEGETRGQRKIAF